MENKNGGFIMAKIIKRAGIVFFALAISCLMIIGLTTIANVNGKNDFSNLNSVIVDNKETPDLDESKYDYKLAGTCERMAQEWSKAVQQSVDNGGANVNVVLMNYWTAQVAESTTKFGDAVGFEAGMLIIPANATITLELNGMTINRALTSGVTGGRIFKIYGTLNIYDRFYNDDKVKEILEITPNALKHLAGFGKLIGGNCSASSPGGAITVEPTGTLNMYGGIICDNKTLDVGGGILNQNIFNLYNGVICDNYAERFGGGVETLGGKTNIYDGVIANNICNIHGGGISFDARVADSRKIRSTGTIYNTIVQNNFSSYYAGGVACYDSDIEIIDIQVKNNQSTNNSAGILVWNNSTLVMKNGTVTGNRMLDRGLNGENGGGGMLVGLNSEVTIEDILIADNVITTNIERDVTGGGILLLSAGILNLYGGVIKNNLVYDISNKYSYGAGVCVRDKNCTFNLGGNVQIYDNKANDVAEDLFVNKDIKVHIDKPLVNAHIGVKLAKSYGDGVLTDGYETYNPEKPNAYFFANDGVKIATLNNNEVSFESTLESDIYDYIYLEDGYRKNYKDNNLVHAVNDYKKSVAVNNGDLILGNIKPNTSVNEFISNINFAGSNVKMYNSKGQIVYNKGNAVSGIDTSKYDNGIEFAIGTGWKLETYNDSGILIETLFLSVLGDINGDGRISASDCTYLRQLANEKSTFESMLIVRKLAGIIDNKGKFTSADGEILRAIINKENFIEFYY